jgi:UDP-N-acetylmuramoyl-tripeptide--D-alanyl-D-alanine ligase
MNGGASAMMMTLGEAASALGARHTGIDGGFSRAIADSRAVQQGDLFVALKGARFDGHDFVTKAAESGAAGALVSRPLPDIVIPQIVVPDTRMALGRLGAHWRNRFSLPLLALTGSNGKTTVKEMLRSILTAASGDREAVLATEGNLNNDIGVPLTLLRLRAYHLFGAIEMGMNHLGEIDYLARLAAPDVALVINAGTAHIGELGSREAIAQAKGELVSALKPGGIACVNMHDRFGAYWRQLAGERRVIGFGILPEDEMRGDFSGNTVSISYGGETVAVRLRVAGEHNQHNALAAAAGAVALGVPLPVVRQGLEQFAGVAGRLQRLQGENGALVINDTYNANPDSVRAAIDVLAKLPGKRILVLGDMGELGAAAAQMHAEVGTYAQHAGLDALFAVGELTQHTVMQMGVNAWHFENVDDLAGELLKLMAPNVTVLVKGSRFMKMERVVEKIAVGFDGGQH